MIGLLENQVALVIQNIVSLLIKKTGSEEVEESDLTLEIFNEALAKSTAEKFLTKVASVGKLPSAALIPKKRNVN